MARCKLGRKGVSGAAISVWRFCGVVDCIDVINRTLAIRWAKKHVKNLLMCLFVLLQRLYGKKILFFSIFLLIFIIIFAILYRI